jgi:hypothetical protein
MLSAENKNSFERAFDAGMLVEKPGHTMPIGSRPGQGQGPGSAASPPRCPGPRSALGTAHTADLPFGPPRTGLASAVAP